MTKLSSHAAMFLVTCSLASPVFADETPSEPQPSEAAPAPPPPTEVATATPAAGDQVAGGTTVTATAPAEVPAPRYPRAVIARPLTLPAGLAMIGADATSNYDFGTLGAAPIFGYGITDEIEVQIPYAFATKEFDIKGALDVDAGYVLARGALGGKFEAIARARVGYDLAGEAARPLLVGVHAQYNATDKLAIISGVPGTQQLKISLAESDPDMDPATPAVTPIEFGLPLGIGYQPTGEFYLQLDTKLATFNISDSATTLIGKDATPISLTGLYNVIPALDVQAIVGTDVSADKPGESFTFLIGARYYAGQL